MLRAVKDGRSFCPKNFKNFYLDNFKVLCFYRRVKSKTANHKKQNMKEKTLSEIASIIRQDWKKVYFGAVPYLQAMATLNSIKDNYGLDSGVSIVSYFLCNASTWRGETARKIKKELNRRIKQS